VAHGGTVVDVNAHLGGCLAGAVLAFVILIAWNDEEETLPGRYLAAIIASGWVVMTVLAFSVSGNTYRQYAKDGLDYIPPENIPADVEAMKADSYSLVEKYPKDPRVHMFRGLYLLEQRNVADAEPYFRNAARLGATSPVMTREFQDWNLALLALTVRVQNRGEEAKGIVAPLCAHTAGLDARTQQTINITKLCD
jgi:rhomboid protease GluP